jgi:hypothetical protein
MIGCSEATLCVESLVIICRYSIARVYRHLPFDSGPLSSPMIMSGLQQSIMRYLYGIGLLQSCAKGNSRPVFGFYEHICRNFILFYSSSIHTGKSSSTFRRLHDSVGTLRTHYHTRLPVWLRYLVRLPMPCDVEGCGEPGPSSWTVWERER